MKNEKMRARLTRFLRLCMVLLLLPSLLLVMPLQAKAVAWTVTGNPGAYTATDGTNTVTVFAIMTAPDITEWTITGVTVGEDTYSYGTNSSFAPADMEVAVALTYKGTDTITADRISIADATVTAGGAANTFIATLTGITADTTLAITVRAPTIKLTFPANNDYTIYHGDQGGTEHQNFSGADFNFDLRLNQEKYAIPVGMAAESLQRIVTKCVITTPEATVQSSEFALTTDFAATEPIIGGSIHGTIPAKYLTENTEISFTIDETQLIALIGVVEKHEPGYTLITKERALAGSPGRVTATLTVNPGYSISSTPTFTAAGYIIKSERHPDAPVIDLYIDCQGSTTVTAPIAVAVTGIEPNNPPPVDPNPPPVDPTPPPSGGGDSGGGGGGEDNAPAAPTIRVENELNKGDIKSDTTLWPGHTTERDGVSTTTVTDAELKALLELARQHAKDIEGIPGEGLKEGIFYIEDLHTTSENATYVLELTGDQLQTLEQEGWDRLTVQTPAGSFSLYPEALAQAGAEITDGSQPVRITLHRLDYENRPGVDANLTVDKKQVTSFETPYGVRIVVPYTPAPGEDVNALIIDYIHEDGTVERVTECHYDPEAGGLVFFTTHLSKFGVAYRPAAFADVTAKHWANPYVTFLASRGVISGYGDKKFRPDDLATRGETIAMLTKALSAVKCPKKPIQVYTDVALGSSISGASNWLYFNNLAPFLTTGTQLKPGASVAKQDVAALVNNVAAGVGLRVRSRGLDTGYTDLGELADYAKPAVIRLTAAGVLTMTANFKFNPKTNLNRGELAQITAALLSNL